MASEPNVCKHGYMVPPCGCFVDEFVAPSAPAASGPLVNVGTQRESLVKETALSFTSAAASGEPTPDLPSEFF